MGFSKYLKNKVKHVQAIVMWKKAFLISYKNNRHLQKFQISEIFKNSFRKRGDFIAVQNSAKNMIETINEEVKYGMEKLNLRLKLSFLFKKKACVC